MESLVFDESEIILHNRPMILFFKGSFTFMMQSFYAKQLNEYWGKNNLYKFKSSLLRTERKIKINKVKSLK